MSKLLLFLFSLLMLPSLVFAHCPLCSAATGMAVATARIYGVDDAIVGLFAGGFAVSTALWMNNIAMKRNGKKTFIAYQSHIFVLASLVLTLITLYAAGMFDGNFVIFGMDKLFFGTIAGTALSFISFEIHQWLRFNNGNRNHIPLQGIVLPLVVLIAAGAGLYGLGWL